MRRVWISLAVIILALKGNSALAQTPCTGLAAADSVRQAQIVEASPQCSPLFVRLLVSNPRTHLQAFYSLITSAAATDSLFLAVYEELRFGRFHFDAAAIDELLKDLPRAASACAGSFRCPDWDRYVVGALRIGGLFRCPQIEDLDIRDLFSAIPYADYSCAETIASALTLRGDAQTVPVLIRIASSHNAAWSRRNGMRVLGRMMEHKRVNASRTVLDEVAERDIHALAADRLHSENDAVVLHEAIWIEDSMFFPAFAIQNRLEFLVRNPSMESALRFRAISAAARLIEAKTSPIDEHDTHFITGSLNSDDPWVRARAAFTCESLPDARLRPAGRQSLSDALLAVWSREDQFTPKIYIARALDRFEGTQSRVMNLRAAYETSHLPNLYSDRSVTIRSALPRSDLARLAERIRNNTTTFLHRMGSEFSEAVPEDPNPTMTVVVFGSQSHYREYMAAFIGSGVDAGGIYLERTGTLYSYQRAASTSVFTLEHAIDHEQTHYLLARYVYPGTWGDIDYHAEPKGWADEGMAEFVAEGGWSADSQQSAKSMHLEPICRSSSFRSLLSLLEQRAGYDQAGTFDYDYSWAFIRYLMNGFPNSAMNLYRSMRNRSYRLRDFAAIFGASSLEEIELGWQSSVRNWCS